MLDKLFTELGLSEKSFVLGETQDEIEKLECLVLEDPKPEFVFVDQNIQTKDGRTIFGTDIAKRIRRKGFTGFLVVVSANVSTDDINFYEKCEVDCVLGKHLSLERKKNIIIAKYFNKNQMGSVED